MYVYISGDPDTGAAVTRPTAKRLATDRALTADLVLHSRTLRGMRDSEYQYNKFLAAHVLSSSCANSGVVVQSVPTVDRQVPDARFRQILRLRPLRHATRTVALQLHGTRRAEARHVDGEDR